MLYEDADFEEIWRELRAAVPAKAAHTFVTATLPPPVEEAVRALLISLGAKEIINRKGASTPGNETALQHPTSRKGPSFRVGALDHTPEDTTKKFTITQLSFFPSPIR